MIRIKLKDITKTRAARALRGKTAEALIEDLKKYRRDGAAAEFELCKLLYVFEVSELWVGLGRYSGGGTYTAFEMFLRDHNDWMVSLVRYQRFKKAVAAIGEERTRNIGIYAVQYAWRIDDAGTRTKVLNLMVATASSNNAPLTEKQARDMIKGKTSRKPRVVGSTELREQNARLLSDVSRLNSLAEENKNLKAENERLRKELSESRALNSLYRERFGAIEIPAAE